MSQMGDISLVAQVVVFHNTRAFDQLVRKYQSPVRRFFLNLTCGDSELSDDLAQDTFIRAYTSLASFKNLSASPPGSTALRIINIMTIFAAARRRTTWTRHGWTPSAACASRTRACNRTCTAHWPR